MPPASVILILVATIGCSTLGVYCVKTIDFVDLDRWLDENVDQNEQVRAELKSAQAKMDSEEASDGDDSNSGARKALGHLVELSQISDQLANGQECDTRSLQLIRLFPLILRKRPHLLRVKRISTSFMNELAKVCLAQLIENFKPMEQSVEELDRTLKLFQRPKDAHLAEILLDGQPVDGQQLGRMLYNLRQSLGYKLRIPHLNYVLEVTLPCNRQIGLLERLMLDLRDILSNQQVVNVEEFVNGQSDTFKDALYVYASCKGAKDTLMSDIEVGFGKQVFGDVTQFLRKKIYQDDTKQQDN